MHVRFGAWANEHTNVQSSQNVYIVLSGLGSIVHLPMLMTMGKSVLSGWLLHT